MDTLPAPLAFASGEQVYRMVLILPAEGMGLLEESISGSSRSTRKSEIRRTPRRRP